MKKDITRGSYTRKIYYNNGNILYIRNIFNIDKHCTITWSDIKRDNIKKYK